VPLALAWAVLVVYASLYPFSGWRAQPGPFDLGFLLLPWPRWIDRFDTAANLAAYVPMGTLVFAAAVRSGASSRRSVWLALAISAVLSYLLEMLQHLLPQRVPSRLDWLLNTAGAGLRERWFAHASPTALTLLLLWPAGLLFPAPVPLGMGQALDRLREQVVFALLDTPWSSLIDSWALADIVRVEPLPVPAEVSVTALGLLAPCLLAYTVTLGVWRRALLVLGAAGVGLATTTLATALNFGPEHATAWITPRAWAGIGAGVAIALALVAVSWRGAAGLGLVVLTTLVALISQAPEDPYFAESLQAWEQGRFIHLHGIAQWIGWLWPYAVLVHLLARIGSREPS
jgi:VanZ family protein